MPVVAIIVNKVLLPLSSEALLLQACGVCVHEMSFFDLSVVDMSDELSAKLAALCNIAM